MELEICLFIQVLLLTLKVSHNMDIVLLNHFPIVAFFFISNVYE